MSPLAAAPRRRAQAALVAVALVPVAVLVLRFFFGDGLGAEPIEEITHTTGEWAMRLLLLTLAVSPLRQWLGWNVLAPFRRTLGLLAFSYAALHLATWLALDQFFDLEAITEDLTERPFVIAGMASFALLVPLAATSTRTMVRRLGRRWLTLHRLVYAAAIAAVIHHIWLVKADLRPALIHAGVLAALLLARPMARVRAERR